MNLSLATITPKSGQVQTLVCSWSTLALGPGPNTAMFTPAQYLEPAHAFICSKNLMLNMLSQKENIFLFENGKNAWLLAAEPLFKVQTHAEISPKTENELGSRTLVLRK
jgi:hypothetical protein